MTARTDQLRQQLTLTDSREGAWTGERHNSLVPGESTARPVLSWRTRLLEPGVRMPWRRSPSDTVLFFHEGAPLSVRLKGTHGDGPAVLGGAPHAGHVLQHTIPAGTWHSLIAQEPRYALWSEASVPGTAPWELAPDGPGPASDTLTGAQPSPTWSAGKSGHTAELLGLVSHVEGGYYRQLYQSSRLLETPRGTRALANTIHYLLDHSSPVGHLHSNVSDITHFLHLGGPIHYLMLSPDGILHERVLGREAEHGQVPAFTCPGGWWKTSFLPPGVDEGLISEIVAPGFDFTDQRLARADEIAVDFPRHARRLEPYTHP
ncbi:cupin domain-containing protein [Streptomyces sp. ME19-01-6]|uniref:cupin domain-containing protein n=1 Tax=Streptomyces sp. ME19-01-6 TaxID=3028686 RepID=UPI0029BB7623|nr:cupin domain-containing protein [Streptomyces sp. ME19-01-6]MDX3230400.1 cupin domain-containing protein [Streptomyces sp. ME19-01-6]